MKFSLDIIWISNGSVSEITTNVGVEQGKETPVTYYPKEPVDYVLEVNAGFVEKNNIQAGDSVKIE